MSKQTRREFLENSMFATAAAITAGTVTLPRLRAEEEKQAISPNEVLRVAVLGIRGRGQSHLGAYLGRGDCKIVAICDADEAVGIGSGVETVARHQGGEKPAFYKDMRKIMENKDIDIVSIATPNHRAPSRSGGAQAQEKRTDRDADSLVVGRARGHRLHGRRQHRRGQAGARSVLQGARFDRPPRQL
jgi:hypothetical protein